MGAASKIGWCDDTFNPWIGCQKVGPGCDHCYAEDWDKRYGGGEHWGPGAPRRLTANDNWKKPVRWNQEAANWNRPRLVFCASLADWADTAVPREWRKRLFDLIKSTPNLIWILVTKRVGNIEAVLPEDWGDGYANVCLVITVCNQAEADRDIPKLLRIPAAIRGVSAEPLLGAIDFRPWLAIDWQCSYCLKFFSGRHQSVCPGCGAEGGWCGSHAFNGRHHPPGPLGPSQRGSGLDWIIPGGESGPHARDYILNDAKSIIEQCASAGVACFHKQIGRRPRWAQVVGRYVTRDKKGEDLAEWPEDLRVRQFPPQFWHPQSIRSAA